MLKVLGRQFSLDRQLYSYLSSQNCRRAYASQPNYRTFPTESSSPTTSAANPSSQKGFQVPPKVASAPESSIAEQDASHSQAVAKSAPTQLTPEAVDVEQTEGAAGGRIPVNPDHGLWHFFRKFAVDDKKRISDVADRFDGASRVTYKTTQPRDPSRDLSGRSWSAAELRTKSFADLHTLWYLLARERNLLATQKEELRRLEVNHVRITSITAKAFRCRKSQARIKYVLNERRLEYLRTAKSPGSRAAMN
ncbi:hypothetical protein SISSUDRAFT_1046386 [Sistotremastrum suecicum HHB10207 ss-3]|uniref:Large ribosomal subunit protein uL29m n=1 Tax=Sistotremastrum suecicum HHB10207 ss-3 TaxID=1314776 RepID=A0A166DUG9_9AGAM|nr:hypothetical protein SISSUDRAFT_1046386 [Sistotremastrum suecicum HHB10207 ss-3]